MPDVWRSATRSLRKGLRDRVAIRRGVVRREKTAPGRLEQPKRSPKNRGALRQRPFRKLERKKRGAVRRSVLVAAPQRIWERLGDDLCDTFIQNAEGKGLGWPLFGRPVLP
jgi:hypothetical protein